MKKGKKKERREERRREEKRRKKEMRIQEIKCNLMTVCVGHNYDSMLDFIEVYEQILSGARDSR